MKTTLFSPRSAICLAFGLAMALDTSCAQRPKLEDISSAVTCETGTSKYGYDNGKVAAVWCARTLDGSFSGAPHGNFVIVGPAADHNLTGRYDGGIKQGQWTFTDDHYTRVFGIENGKVVQKKAYRTATQKVLRKGLVDCDEKRRCECVVTSYEVAGPRVERNPGDNCNSELPPQASFVEENHVVGRHMK